MQKMFCDGIIALRLRFIVSQAFGEQLARPFNRMLLLCDMVFTVIKQAGQRFAGGTPVHTVLYPMRQTRHQRRAFYQPLRINHSVVLVCAYRPMKGYAFRFNGRGKPGLAPTANSDGNHAIDSTVPGRNLCKPFFDNPIKLNPRNRLLRVGKRRQGM
ncbi:Uncharacterised protein [Salmonella enterica subsp. enterica serovar Typhi]|nr:Uncharacterised protein [Salmonella enterica subsp. enterica serovar Typhi]